MPEKEVNWKKVRLLIIIPLLIFSTIIYMFSCGGGDLAAADEDLASASEEAVEESDEAVDDESSESDSGQIVVDVGGAVRSPGVVVLRQDARVYEAVEGAGGLSESAETRYINMAAFCTDGQKVYIPDKEEVAAEGSQGENYVEAGWSQDMQSGQQTSSSQGGQVNINTADAAALQTLSGVGPSTAAKIISYRQQNGLFKSIEDLTKVSGIGTKTFEKLKNSICV